MTNQRITLSSNELAVAQRVAENRDRNIDISPDKFRAFIRYEGDGIIVNVHGELDVATRPALWSTLSRAMAENDITSVSVNLEKLEFIDAHGMGALVAARNVLRTQSRDFGILNLSTRFARLIALAGLGELLDYCEQDRAVTVLALSELA